MADSVKADPPIPDSFPAPDPACTDLADYVVQAYFERDQQNRIVCLRCGSVIAEGWAATHFRNQHLFKGL